MKEEGKRGSEGGYRGGDFLRRSDAPDNSNPTLPTRKLGMDPMTSTTDDLLLLFTHLSSFFDILVSTDQLAAWH